MQQNELKHTATFLTSGTETIHAHGDWTESSVGQSCATEQIAVGTSWSERRVVLKHFCIHGVSGWQRRCAVKKLMGYDSKGSRVTFRFHVTSPALPPPHSTPTFSLRAANLSLDLAVMKSDLKCNDRILNAMYLFW